jgi:hypothetical protein
MDASIGVTHFTSAAIVVYVINKLKSASWFPLLQKDWTVATRSFSIFIAFLVSQGIAYAWNPTSRQLVITLPTLSAFALGVWHWLNQYAMQETLHQLTKPKVIIMAPPTPGPAA